MGLSREQKRIAKILLSEADRLGASPRERKALIQAGLVESNLTNVNYGDRDGLGVLQQRPSQGWGTPGQVMNPRYAARKFLKAAKAANTGKGSAGQLAQAVQRSAFPGRYDERSPDAERILDEVSGGRTRGGSQNPRSAAGPGLTFDPAVTESVLAQELQKTAKPQSMGLEAPEFSSVKNLAVAGMAVRSSGAPEQKADSLDAQLAALKAAEGIPTAKAAQSTPTPGKRPAKTRGTLLEMFHDPGINIDSGQRTKPIGGHGKHVHVAFSDPKAVREAARLAQSMGLHVGENDVYDPVDPVHTEGSFHYQKFKGKKLGKALDVSGDPAKLLAYNRLIAKRFR